MVGCVGALFAKLNLAFLIGAAAVGIAFSLSNALDVLVCPAVGSVWICALVLVAASGGRTGTRLLRACDKREPLEKDMTKGK